MMELYQSITEHFIRLFIVDSLKLFRSSIPRKKKQALRTKVQALGERNGVKRKTSILTENVSKRKKKDINSVKKDKHVKPSDTTSENAPVYICPVCDNVCEEEPVDSDGESIGCDRCDNWFHYGCVDLTGNEFLFKQSDSSRFCQPCSKKGESRGKGKGKGKYTRK